MKLVHDIYTLDGITQITASSSQAQFPVSNLTSPIRAKEWRSSGTFIIDAFNDGLLIDEGSGNVAVTITQGSYTTQSLIAEIESKLSALTLTYTVSFSKVDFLWTIEADGNFEMSGSLLSVLGFTGVYSGENSYEASDISIHTEETVTFDLRTTEEVNTIALLWKAQDYRLSDDAIIILEGNSTNVWNAPAFTVSLAFDNRNEIAQAHFTTQSFRYWRVKIQDATNAYGYVSLGVAVLGKSDSVITFTSNGFTLGFKDYTKIFETDDGQAYADLGVKLKTASLNFEALTNAEQEAMIALFQKVGTAKPVFMQLDPTETVLLADYFIFGRLNSPLSMRHTALNYFGTSVEIQETN